MAVEAKVVHTELPVIDPDEVCGHRYAWPHVFNSLGGELITGDEAVDFGGAWRKMPRVRDLRERVQGAIRDCVHRHLSIALAVRGIGYFEVADIEERLELAVERVHNSDYLPREAAEGVAREIEEALRR